MKNRLALLFFAVLLVTPAAYAQRRRPSASPPVQQPDDGCSARTMLVGSYTADFAIDAQFIYFTDSANGIFRMPKSGGTPELVAMIPDNFIDTLAIDDTTIYAITTNDNLTLGSVWSVDKSGGTPHALAANLLTPYALSVDANYVFFTSIGTPTSEGFFADGSLMRVKKDGTGLTTMVSNLNVPTGVASDGTNVYFTETGLSLQNSSAGLRIISVNGGQARALTSGSKPAVTIELTGTDIYFSTIDPGNGGAILRMPKSGGSSQTLANNLDAVVKMVLAGDRIYFFNTDDVETVQWIPLTGGTPQLAVGGDFYSQTFALSDCAIFTVDGNGAIKRTPR